MVNNHPADVSKAAMYRRNLRLDDDVQPIALTGGPSTSSARLPPDVGPSVAPPHMNRSNSPDISISSFILTNSQRPRCLPRQVNGQHLPY